MKSIKNILIVVLLILISVPASAEHSHSEQRSVSINSTTPFGGFIHVVILPFKVVLTATSHIMTKSEFQKLQVKVASSGTTLTEFLRSEGV